MGDAILIIGAARSGVASAEYLLSIGKQIVISDMNTKLAEDVETQLGHASVSYVWGKQPDVAALQPGAHCYESWRSAVDSAGCQGA